MQKSFPVQVKDSDSSHMWPSFVVVAHRAHRYFARLSSPIDHKVDISHRPMPIEQLYKQSGNYIG